MIIEAQKPATLVQPVTPLKTIIIKDVGQQGARGPSGGNLAGPAGEVLSGHRVLTLSPSGFFVYSDSLHGVGIGANAANIGDPVEVIISGPMEDPSWNWVPELPIYQTGMGQLTQVVPVTGFVREVAFAVAPHRILVSFRPPIILE